MFEINCTSMYLSLPIIWRVLSEYPKSRPVCHPAQADAWRAMFLYVLGNGNPDDIEQRMRKAALQSAVDAFEIMQVDDALKSDEIWFCNSGGEMVARVYNLSVPILWQREMTHV